MDKTELLKTTISNSKFSQNLKPLIHSETVAFIIPLHRAGLAEAGERWQQIYVVTQPWKNPLLSLMASATTFHINNKHRVITEDYQGD